MSVFFFQAPVDKTSIAGNIKLREAFGVQKEFFFVGEPAYDLGDTKVTFRTKVSSSDIGLQNNTRYEILIDGVVTVEGERFKTSDLFSQLNRFNTFGLLNCNKYGICTSVT